MNIVGQGRTDPGKKRDHNEDFFVADARLGLYLVCDGVGGGNAGEIASRLAAETIHREILKHDLAVQAYATAPTAEKRDDLIRKIETAVGVACTRIWNEAEADPKKKGMATTLVLALFAGKNVILAHVGDSRIYLIRHGKIHQMTQDHSFVNEQIKKGILTVEQADKSPYAHVITRALGMQELVEVDSLNLEVSSGDSFVLCSDGLSDYLKGSELGEMCKKKDPAASAADLVQYANSCGGKDNVTAVVVRAEGTAAADPALEIQNKMDALRKIPLFRHLSYQDLTKVLNIVTIKSFPAENVIIKEGSMGDEFYVLLSGSVRVTKKGKTLATLEAGSFFGEMQLIDKVARSATIAVIKPVQVLVVSREKLFPLLRREPLLSAMVFWEFCQVLNSRLRSINELFVGSKEEGKSSLETLPFFTDPRN